MGLLKLIPADAEIEDMVPVALALVAWISYALHSLLYRWLGLLIALGVDIVVLGVVARWLHFFGVGVFGLQWGWLRQPAKTASSLVSTPQQKDTLRVVLISDTHGHHSDLKVPDGDVLIHCGDFTNRGLHSEIEAFNTWLGTLPHRHKIVVAGNHDLSMDGAEYKERLAKLWKHTTFQDPVKSRELLTNCTYIEDRSIVIDGVKIYGSPMSTPIPGRIMAFNVEPGFASEQHWAKIPGDVDVLITHGPPRGILDKTFTGAHVGEEELLKHVVSRVRPQVHAFGHIHESYGISRLGSTVFINCASSTLTRKVEHAPIVVDVLKKSTL